MENVSFSKFPNCGFIRKSKWRSSVFCLREITRHFQWQKPNSFHNKRSFEKKPNHRKLRHKFIRIDENRNPHGILWMAIIQRNRTYERQTIIDKIKIFINHHYQININCKPKMAVGEFMCMSDDFWKSASTYSIFF